MKYLSLFLGITALCAAQTPSPAAHVTAQGSREIYRSVTDLDAGLVVIYTGGFFPNGTVPSNFRFLFDTTYGGNTTGYLTPLFLEASIVGSYTVYTVVGIGEGFNVSLSAAAQTIPFRIVEGTKAAYNRKFTFGYVNALVGLDGIPFATSPGVTDFQFPAEAGRGVGGRLTSNTWSATNFEPLIAVSLGATFGPAGSNADYTFFEPDRTYSAEALGAF